jgi:16S rRNA (guanine966-N2)-methyltransferase
VKAAGAVRIQAGSLKGRALAVGGGTRPTEARVRAALLAVWTERLPDARCLDLFAGSGAVGLEAISRGAREAVFVERSRAAAALLQKNLGLAPPGSTRALQGDVMAVLERLAREPDRFDLVFADPPYDWQPTPEFFAAVAAVADPDGELALERSRRAEAPAAAGGWVRTSLRRYGETTLSFYGRGS